MQKLFDFVESIKPFCQADTAYRPDLYRQQKNHPLFGHCVPVTLVIQARFGGSIKIYNAIPKNDPETPIGHVANIIDGQKFDGTADQLNDRYVLVTHLDYPNGAITKEKLLSYSGLKEKYELFESRIQKSHPLPSGC